jgi:hypothetical protein
MSAEEIPSAGEYQAAVSEMEQDDRTPSEIEYDRQLDRLDSLFSSLSPGVTLLIQRIQPSWCKGVLEEITIGDDEVNLDYFIETWGGHLLLVKIRGASGKIAGNYKIPLFSYPPMVYGKKLKYNDKSDRFLDEPESIPNANPAPQSPIVVKSDSGMEQIVKILPTIIPLITEYSKANEARRQADMAMMMQIMHAQNNSGLSDITKIGSVMSQLSEMFKRNNEGGGGASDMDFMASALDTIKTVFANKTEKKSEPRLIAPVKARPGAPPVAPPIAPPVKLTSNVTPLKNSTDNIAKSISELDPRSISDTIIQAMSRMEPGKRNEAIGHFLAEYEADMAADVEGDYEEDDQSIERG